MNGWFKINYLRKRVARTDATRSSLKCTESNGPYSYDHCYLAQLLLPCVITCATTLLPCAITNCFTQLLPRAITLLPRAIISVSRNYYCKVVLLLLRGVVFFHAR